MDIADFVADLSPYVKRMRAARESVTEPIDWYQYDILGNLIHLDRLLPPGYRDLDELAQGRPVADIGAADGDLAFTLEAELGWELDVIDNPPTNMNGLRGAAALKQALGSKVSIHKVDLDQQFTLPRDDYGLVLLLGILYHLKNPFYVLEELSRQSRHCLMSTRVTQLAGSDRRDIADLPVAYLVDRRELNGDGTNFWIFTPTGLRRLAERAGWEVIATLNYGDTENSVPDSNEGDERMMMLLRSRR